MSTALAADPLPLVVHDDGVIRIGDTRVTLDTVIAAFQEGESAETIVEQYPPLTLAEVYSAIAYYLRHQSQMDAYLQDRQKQADAVRAANEARFPPIGIRQRLMARRQNPAADWVHVLDSGLSRSR